MRNNLKREPPVAIGRYRRDATDERRELALLAEFNRHDSVASLAGAIAARLGGNAREEDLIACASLGSEPDRR